MSGLKIKNWLIYLLLFCFFILCHSSLANAQNWVALSPFNTLWPLWSPALSPIDPITGLPAPIVNNLSPGTILPVEPGLTWDPVLNYPYLLFNSPDGLVYYNFWGGIEGGLLPWPPGYLQATFNEAGNIWTLPPSPLTLPAGYADLPPTSPLWLAQMIPVAFANYFYNFPPPGYSYYDWMDPEGIAINPSLTNFIISVVPDYLSAADIIGYPFAFDFITISDMLY
jgi:hypothetical protein